MKKCKYCGIKNKSSYTDYCNRHYQQIIKYGGFLKNTCKDTQKIINKGTYSEIALSLGKGLNYRIIGYFKFDKQDIDLVKESRWNFCKGYMVRLNKKTNKTELFHRVILKVPKKLKVDHINHNGLDNRRINIRICTQKENSRNMLGHKKSTSKYKGVSLHKGLWLSQIRTNGKNYLIGKFKNELHAAMAYDLWAKELFGKFAYLNFQI